MNKFILGVMIVLAGCVERPTQAVRGPTPLPTICPPVQRASGFREEWVAARPDLSEGVKSNLLAGVITLAAAEDAYRRELYVAKNPVSPERKKAILAGKLQFGMTIEDVQASCGTPDSVTVTMHDHVEPRSLHTWVYGDFPTQYRIVRFTNGVLSSWTEGNSRSKL